MHGWPNLQPSAQSDRHYQTTTGTVDSTRNQGLRLTHHCQTITDTVHQPPTRGSEFVQVDMLSCAAGEVLAVWEEPDVVKYTGITAWSASRRSVSECRVVDWDVEQLHRRRQTSTHTEQHRPPWPGHNTRHCVPDTVVDLWWECWGNRWWRKRFVQQIRYDAKEEFNRD